MPSYYATLLCIYFIVLPFLYGQSTLVSDTSLQQQQEHRPGASEAARAISTLWFNSGDGCPEKLWANFLFVNNQLERAGCMKYAWSQAVQVHGILSTCTILSPYSILLYGESHLFIHIVCLGLVCSTIFRIAAWAAVVV